MAAGEVARVRLPLSSYRTRIGRRPACHACLPLRSGDRNSERPLLFFPISDPCVMLVAASIRLVG